MSRMWDKFSTLPIFDQQTCNVPKKFIYTVHATSPRRLTAVKYKNTKPDTLKRNSHSGFNFQMDVTSLWSSSFANFLRKWIFHYSTGCIKCTSKYVCSKLNLNSITSNDCNDASILFFTFMSNLFV